MDDFSRYGTHPAEPHGVMIIAGAGLINAAEAEQFRQELMHLEFVDETWIVWGIASAAQGGVVHMIAAAPLEITASMIAAMRENARRTNKLDALTAAVDRQEMQWREL